MPSEMFADGCASAQSAVHSVNAAAVQHSVHPSVVPDAQPPVHSVDVASVQPHKTQAKRNKKRKRVQPDLDQKSAVDNGCADSVRAMLTLNRGACDEAMAASADDHEVYSASCVSSRFCRHLYGMSEKCLN